jgi:hypothetical protein
MISGKETDDVSGAARPARGDSPLDEVDEHQATDADGCAAAGPAEEDEEASPKAPPANVAELAAACVRFVATRYGAALDFAPETLSFVDHWLREARTDVAERPEAAELVQAAAGAYLGEVIRRTFGGFWLAEGSHAEWRLRLERVYCAFNPIGMAREALLLEPAEGWHAHFELDPGEAEAMGERLAALPPATDEEYYAPSTRFDVVSILFEALRTGMRARGLSDVRFAPEDYSS